MVAINNLFRSDTTRIRNQVSSFSDLPTAKYRTAGRNKSAEGSTLSTIPKIAAPEASTDPIDVAKMVRNPYLATLITARLNEVFAFPPEITVYKPTEDGVADEMEPFLTDVMRKMAESIHLPVSMRRTYREILCYGASVKSVEYSVGDPAYQDDGLAELGPTSVYDSPPDSDDGTEPEHPPQKTPRQTPHERAVESLASDIEKGVIPSEEKLVRIVELRDLPAESFSTTYTYGLQAPINGTLGNIYIPNPLMRGLAVVVDPKNPSKSELHVYQRDPTNKAAIIPNELHNVKVIIHPDGAYPCGEAVCADIYPLVKKIDLVTDALTKQTARTGVPIIFPKITDDVMGSDLNMLIRYCADISEHWGDTSSCTLLPHMELADAKIHESPYTLQWLTHLVDRLRCKFTPSDELSPMGNPQLLGGSDEGKATLHRTFITSEQQWICDAYRGILQECLDRSGLSDYYVELTIPKPEKDISTSIIAQLQVAAAGVTANSSISDGELRERLTLLNLPHDLPAELLERREQEMEMQKQQMAFGNAFKPGALKKKDSDKKKDSASRPANAAEMKGGAVGKSAGGTTNAVRDMK